MDTWYNRHRPNTLDELVGQDEAVAIIRGYGKNIPSPIMITGPSGCGKTTTARILARMAGVKLDDFFSYSEFNCGEPESAIGKVRDLIRSANIRTMNGEKRVWVMDEVQTLSRNKGAQEAMLKILEDGPKHALFILLTNEPQRVLKTVRNRCAQIVCKTVPDALMSKLLQRISAAEKIKTPEEAVINRIMDVAQGSVRQAIVELEKVARLKDTKSQLAALNKQEEGKDVASLAMALLPYQGEAVWSQICVLLEELKEHDPESIRLIVLAFARKAIISANAKRAALGFKATLCFDRPLYDRSSGHALLAASCYEFIHRDR